MNEEIDIVSHIETLLNEELWGQADYETISFWCERSPDSFFNKDIYCFPCSFTGIDICFVGDADYVDDEIILVRTVKREPAFLFVLFF